MKTLIMLLALALVISSAALRPRPALADQHLEPTRLTVESADEATLGDTVTVTASLTTAAGRPVAGATVTVLTPAVWGEEIKGEIELGAARTDAAGVARVSFQARRSGDTGLIARFAGDERLAPAGATRTVHVTGDRQLYTPELPAVSARVSRLAPWAISIALATVWSLYFVVARLVRQIARAADLTPVLEAEGGSGASRRRFLQTLVPTGMQAAVLGIGPGLVTVIVRSPYTHANLREHTPASHYHRTPYAHTSGEEHMEELPPVLDREVSFSREVLPILLAYGGPHVTPPKNSPPPHGIRLDSYEHIMAKEGLVEPGKPEHSELVDVLVNPAMRMPPSLPPLPEEEIQLIVSWIAQGANDN